jgi:hypothetical protein
MSNWAGISFVIAMLLAVFVGVPFLEYRLLKRKTRELADDERKGVLGRNVDTHRAVSQVPRDVVRGRPR